MTYKLGSDIGFKNGLEVGFRSAKVGSKSISVDKLVYLHVVEDTGSYYVDHGAAPRWYITVKKFDIYLSPKVKPVKTTVNLYFQRAAHAKESPPLNVSANRGVGCEAVVNKNSIYKEDYGLDYSRTDPPCTVYQAVDKEFSIDLGNTYIVLVDLRGFSELGEDNIEAGVRPHSGKGAIRVEVYVERV